ncbi:GYD domain-containing protein [Microvirga terricola]|uniref:GYD domain-containing protein n=1 Tax=Microvirga terricola TaxID=2719797 RepID=A0ABX0V9I1_9HYPH|nr:GYD domain-containing protein [Microvirga terricola]NIX76495.1 GYD domain-containing protein [Microvirga terricola]
MPIFITQGRFTQQALKGMLARPEDRAEAVGEFIAKAGGRMIAYYMTFGEYDFLTISEGPFDGAATGAIVAGASGAVTDLKTTFAMTSAEMKAAFTKAGSITASFHPAGVPLP